MIFVHQKYHINRYDPNKFVYLHCQEQNDLMRLIKKFIMIKSTNEKTISIQLDSQKTAIIDQVYSMLFNQEQAKEKNKGLRILEQRPSQKQSIRLQERLMKLLAHLKGNIVSMNNKQSTTQKRVCKILKHFMDRNEEMANEQIQHLLGEIKTSMLVFAGCYFYQNIPLDNQFNLPLRQYFDAIVTSQTSIADIEDDYKKLPEAQAGFFYFIHQKICKLKLQSIKFQKIIEERDKVQLKIDNIKSILSEMASLQEKMNQQRTFGTLGRKIQESPQDCRLSFKRIYSSLMDLSKKSTQRQEQVSSRTLFNEMKNENNNLRRNKQYLKQENQELKKRIEELQKSINSNSHQIYDKSKKEEQMSLKMSQLEDSNKALKKQASLYEDKVQQVKALTSKINELNEAIVKNKETFQDDHEMDKQNLKLAKYSLTILAAEKDQQKIEYAKLQQRNTQFIQEMSQLRNQIIVLKQQNVNLSLQAGQSDNPTDEIITKLRTNEKIQKKNQDMLADLFEKEKFQSREVSLQASRLRESNEASQNIIRKLKEDVEKYKRMLQQCQGNMKMCDID